MSDSMKMALHILRAVKPINLLLTGTLMLAGFFWFRNKKWSLKDITLNKRKKFLVNLLQKLRDSNRNIVVLYGSQTGTAEQFANRISINSHRYGLGAIVMNPEDIDFESIPEIVKVDNSLLVICTATFGEGGAPDNIKKLFDWLRKRKLPLKDLKYAIFGLGNKTYETFNAASKYIDSRFTDLQAVRIGYLGLGDDDGIIEQDFMSWEKDFWVAVCSEFGLVESQTKLSRQYELIVHQDRNSFLGSSGGVVNLFTGEPTEIGSYDNPSPPYNLKNPRKCKPMNYRELYNGDRSCLHIEFDLEDQSMSYETGDHLVVVPKIQPELVETLQKLLDIDLDTIISLQSLDEFSSKPAPIPCPCSYRTAFTNYVDIAQMPQVQVLKELIPFATDQVDITFLDSLCERTADGKSKYTSWIIESRRNIVQVLDSLTSLKPPPDLLIELLPRLQPRYFSISSSSLVSPRQPSITAVVVEYTSLAGYTNKGVATNYLKRTTLMNDGPTIEIPICINKSEFRLPKVVDKEMPPIIMIGPGTGLAPFRGFLLELQHLSQARGVKLNQVVLYYGCRNKGKDSLYLDELAAFQKVGTLTKLRIAFSRDQPDKVYVTHLLEEDCDEIWHLIDELKACVYVCGEAKSMAKNVMQILRCTVTKKLNCDHQASEAYLKTMEQQNRYRQDVWS